MAYIPLSSSISDEPLKRQSAFGLIILRDQLSLGTWLLIGAAIQSILFTLPIRPTYVALPTFLILFIKATEGLLITFNLKENPYLKGTIGQKFSAIVPNADGTFGPKLEEAGSSKNEKVAILLLGFNANHPLGLFSPGSSELSKFFDVMVKDMQANSTTNGYLGHNAFLGDPQGRSSKSDIMTTFYFRSLADIQAWAHGPVHREGWNWWAKHRAQHRHLAIMHEVYEAPRGGFENIYENFRPTGIAATSFPVSGKDGEGWISPVVGAAKGKLTGAAGRLKAYDSA